MTGQEIFLTILIIVALLLIVTEKLRADIVALIVMLSLTAAGTVRPEQALSGFSRSAVITIMGLFIITSALDKTGVTQVLAERLIRLSGKSEARMIFVFMMSGATLSLVMNNIAAGAVLLPAAISVSRRTGIPPSKILIPVSFGTLLGGMATFFTTANIIVSTTLRDSGFTPLGVFDFTPTGGVILLAGIAYMMLIGRRLLPVRTPISSQMPIRSSPEQVQRFYQLEDRLWEAVVLPGSPVAGQTLSEAAIGAKLGVTVVAIWHNHAANLSPTPTDVIHANDILLIAGREDRVSQLTNESIRIGRNSNGSFHADRRKARVSLFEVIVAPHSQVEGRTIKDLNFRKKYGLTAVALWRDGRSYRTDVGNFQLRFGDAILLVGPADQINVLRREPDFIVLESDESMPPVDPWKAWMAFGITALVLALAALNLIPNIAIAMMFGALLMVLTGCLTMDESYRAIEWRAIFLIAGMLPISIAMTETGLAQRLGETLVNVLGGAGPLAVLGGIYVLTVLLGQIMSGQVTALVLAPIAISAAQQMGTSPQAAGIAVAIGCSTSFLTPIAHPVNVLMMGPGGYNFGDFFKVGWGLALVCFIALMIALPLFWPI